MYLDIHAHMYKYPYPLSYDREKDEFQMLFPNGEQLVKLHDEIGIDRAVIVPLVSAFTRNNETEADRVNKLFSCYEEIK